MRQTSSLGLLGAILLVGCPGPVDPCASGTMICIDVPIGGDGGVDTGGRDTPMVDSPVAPGTCGTPGRFGGACRTPGNTCETGSMCQAALLLNMGVPRTVSEVFGIPQGEMDPTNPGYYREVATPDAADEIPLIVAPGGFCSQICDSALGLQPGPDGMFGTADDIDMDCSACSTCSTDVGNIGLLATYLFYEDTTAGRPFGTNTGWCRADCVFDPATNGGCPTGYTCSPSGNICVEACTTDTECQFTFETQRNGLAVSVLDPTHGTCNTTTGRCEWTPTGTPHVGDTCEASSDCAADIGVCLRGGTCATYTCPDATTDGTFNCDLEGGTRNGICLGNGDNFGAICIQGCNTSADCNPGSACLPLGDTAGRFTGYCLGICDTVMSPADPGPDGVMGTADDIADEIWNCRADERCDMGDVTATEPDPVGNCLPTCMNDTDCDMDLGERCEMQPSPATYGFCRVPDQVCGVDTRDADCYLGQVCDLLGLEGNNGLCVDACTADTDCDAGDECDMTRGVCRTPCPMGTECAATVEVCQAGYCEQNTM